VKPASSSKKAASKKDRPKPRTADPEAEKAVSAYLKAIGGRETLQAIKDRYEKFEVIRHSTTGKTTAIFERYLKYPGMVREDWDMDVKVGDQKLKVLQTYNGKTGEGWTKMMGYVAKLEGNMIYMLTWDKYLGDFFLTWKEDGYALKYRSGDGSVGGEACHVIDVYAPAGDQQFRYFFSKKSGLLLKKQWTSESQDGPANTELFFTEYRKVNNPKMPDKPILFSFRREQFAEGVISMERQFLEIRLNSGLDDQIFGRPPGPVFEGRITSETEKSGKKISPPPKKKKLPPWKQKRRIVPKGAGSVPPKAPEKSDAKKEGGEEKKAAAGSEAK
jgi:hypothetical protein